MGYAIQSQGVWTSYTPTFGGFSSAPINQITKYMLVGKTCTVQIYTGFGTSNATTFTITMPFTAATITNNAWVGTAQVFDNGTAGTAPGYLSLSSNSATLSVFKDNSGAAWTNSGNKLARFVFTYEIA